MKLDERLWRAAEALRDELDRMKFAAPVTHVYNPLHYAAKPHRAYLRKFGATKKKIVLLGMNPGPFGMAQTGVPFGEIAHVRDFLGIDGASIAPRTSIRRGRSRALRARAARSAARGCGAGLKTRHETAERFFAGRFVANYCPLVFMEERGKNRTPDKLPASPSTIALFAACDDAAAQVVAVLGRVGDRRRRVRTSARRARARGTNVRDRDDLASIPASPLANRGWAEQAERQMKALGLQL